MRTKKLLSLIITSLVLLAGCAPKIEPEEPCNFVQNAKAQRVSWNEEVPIQIFLDDSVPQKYVPAIIKAMKTWDENLGSRPVFNFAGIIDQGDRSIQDKASVIYWREDWDEVRPGEQARTTIFWKGNQIQEADVQINAQDFVFSTDNLERGSIDLESLMVHEFGHVLGLSHNEEGGSVMAARLAAATPRRDPSKDDIDALRCEY